MQKYGNRSLEEVLQTKEYERIRQLMPIRFSSLDYLPKAEDLKDEDFVEMPSNGLCAAPYPLRGAFGFGMSYSALQPILFEIHSK